MGLIFLASSTSDPTPLPPGYFDKVAHLAIYAVLGLLLLRALARGRPSGYTPRAGVLAVVASALRDYAHDTATLTELEGKDAHRAYYEAFFDKYRVQSIQPLALVTDEWHQSFVPGRTADPMDVVADVAGAALGAAAGVLAARWRRATDPSQPSRTPGPL